MKRIFFLLIVCLCCALSAGENLLLWEASRPGKPGKLYLAGAVHFGKAAWYPLDQAYDEAFAKSEKVMFEIYKPDPSKLAEVMMPLMISEQPVPQIIGAEKYQKIFAFLKEKNCVYPANIMDRVRPWVHTLTLMMIYLKKYPEWKQEYGLENLFTNAMGKKEGGSLESLGYQLMMLASIPDSEMADRLLADIRDEAKSGEELAAIEQCFLSGNLDTLEKYNEKLRKESPLFYENLVLKRNRAMTASILQLFEGKQTVFILVGSAHFCGEDGILNLLRKAGCTIRQVKASGKKGTLKPAGMK